MERIGDLPAHPLIVHLPVVMIPLLALLALVMAVHPGSRRALSGYSAIAGVVTLIATILAASSGEALAEVFGEGSNYAEQIADHRGQGELLRLFMLVFAAVLVGLWWAGRRFDNNVGGGLAADAAAAGKSVLLAVSILSVVVGLASAAWVFRTGHSGASESWGNALPSNDESSSANIETGTADAAAAPADEPTALPAEPTAVPTAEPTAQPTVEPTAQPVAAEEPADEPLYGTQAEADPTADDSASAADEADAPGEDPPAEEEPAVVAVDPLAEADLVNGAALYATACARCHGDAGEGTRQGRPLVGISVEADAAVHVESTLNGKGGMPAFSSSLSVEDVVDVVAFARSL